jgi:hypothetical protein
METFPRFLWNVILRSQVAPPPVSWVQSSRNWEFLSLISVLGKPCHCGSVALSPDLLSPDSWVFVRVKAGGLTPSANCYNIRLPSPGFWFGFGVHIFGNLGPIRWAGRKQPQRITHARCTQIPQIDNSTTHLHYCTASHHSSLRWLLAAARRPFCASQVSWLSWKDTARRAVRSIREKKNTHTSNSWINRRWSEREARVGNTSPHVKLGRYAG